MFLMLSRHIQLLKIVVVLLNNNHSLHYAHYFRNYVMALSIFIPHHIILHCIHTSIEKLSHEFINIIFFVIFLLQINQFKMSIFPTQFLKLTNNKSFRLNTSKIWFKSYHVSSIKCNNTLFMQFCFINELIFQVKN